MNSLNFQNYTSLVGQIGSRPGFGSVSNTSFYSALTRNASNYPSSNFMSIDEDVPSYQLSNLQNFVENSNFSPDEVATGGSRLRIQEPQNSQINIGSPTSQDFSEEPATITDTFVDDAAEATETLAEDVVADVATESIGFSNPLLMVNAMMGQGVNEAAANVTTSNINQQYTHNISVPGMQNQLHAQIIQAWQNQNAAHVSAMGNAFSFLGPLGTLLGRGIGSLTTEAFDPSLLNTGFSSSGPINPDDTGIESSANSLLASGTDSADSTSLSNG